MADMLTEAAKRTNEMQTPQAAGNDLRAECGFVNMERGILLARAGCKA